MDINEKLTIIARSRGKKKKKSRGSGRSAMLKVVMKMLSGDKSAAFVTAVTEGNPDVAKKIWDNMGDDLYQAVEMIRDEIASKARKHAPKQEDSNSKPKQDSSSEGTDTDIG